MARYGCKKCRKEVKPRDGKLSCCGITELVPANRPIRSNCKKCGGYPAGSAAGMFLGMECFCGETEVEKYQDAHADEEY